MREGGLLLNSPIIFAFAMVITLCLVWPENACARNRPKTEGWRFHVKPEPHSSQSAGQLTNELTTGRNRFGAAILEVRRNGETVFSASKGEVDTNTVFPIASGSKWLIAATMMRLVDEGLISLDDQVRSYIPEFRRRKSRITVRHLLSHTSGLPELEPRKGALSEGGDAYCTRVARSRLQADPGTTFIYGNTSFRVAKRVAETVTGQSFEDVFRSRVALPLELKCTSFKGSKERGLRGPVSCSRDYGKYMEAFVLSLKGQPGGLWSQESAAQMLIDHSADKTVRPGGRLRWAEHSQDGYGLGVWIQYDDEKRRQPRIISHYGSSGFRAGYDLKTGVSEVFLTKKKPRTGRWLRRRLERVIAAAWRFGELKDNIVDSTIR